MSSSNEFEKLSQELTIAELGINDQETYQDAGGFCLIIIRNFLLSLNLLTKKKGQPAIYIRFGMYATRTIYSKMVCGGGQTSPGTYNLAFPG